jgi:hypothetical protein
VQIIGAPGFFPTVWGWIKKWFDPITTSKIFIISAADVKKTLETFIDPANIPKKYGGELDFEFGDMPVLDPHFNEVMTWENGNTTFPHGPMYWKKGEKEDEVELIAVGSVDEKERLEKVCVLKGNFKAMQNGPEYSNGHAVVPKTEQVLGDSLAKPTEVTKQVDVDAGTNENVHVTAPEDSKVEVQEGEVVTTSRPELQTFVTATEGLSLNDDSAINEAVQEISEKVCGNGLVTKENVAQAAGGN